MQIAQPLVVADLLAQRLDPPKQRRIAVDVGDDRVGELLARAERAIDREQRVIEGVEISARPRIAEERVAHLVVDRIGRAEQFHRADEQRVLARKPRLLERIAHRGRDRAAVHEEEGVQPVAEAEAALEGIEQDQPAQVLIERRDTPVERLRGLEAGMDGIRPGRVRDQREKRHHGKAGRGGAGGLVR